MNKHCDEIIPLFAIGFSLIILVLVINLSIVSDDKETLKKEAIAQGFASYTLEGEFIWKSTNNDPK